MEKALDIIGASRVIRWLFHDFCTRSGLLLNLIIHGLYPKEEESKMWRITVQSCLDTRVDTFLMMVSQRYAIPKKSLNSLLSQDKDKSMLTTKTVEEKKPKKLQTLSKNELVLMCQEKNLSTRGTKFDMVQRLTALEKPGILAVIHNALPTLVIHRKNGRLVHDVTQLVLDNEINRRVIGRLDGNDVRPLQYEDIQTCLLYKFKYVLPENLSSSLTTSSSDMKKDKRETVYRRLVDIQSGMHTSDADHDDGDESDTETET
jgi:hypothetical protein